MDGLKKHSKKGQSLAEYGLIVALIAIVCIGALTTFGQQLKGSFDHINGEINGAITSDSSSSAPPPAPPAPAP